MNPLITLSIPIYNVEKYVEKSLTSALNQTYDNLEILVIDDKGTDNSMDVVLKVIESHPRGNAVKIIDHVRNQGLGATRNTSIDNAKGEYLFFMDSDDVITEDCIETLYSAMKETPVDFVVGSIDEVDDEGNLIFKRTYIDSHYTSNNDILNAQYNPEWKRNGKSSHLIAPIWNKLYNISFLREKSLRCIPYQKNEDDLFSFILYLKSNSCRILSTPTYKYNIARPGSTMFEARKGFTDFQLKQELDNLEYYVSYINYIKENSGDASKFILNSIIARSASTKYKLRYLNFNTKDYKTITKKMRILTAQISFIDIPVRISSFYFWFYLKSPRILDPMFEWIYSQKEKSKNKV